VRKMNARSVVPLEHEIQPLGPLVRFSLRGATGRRVLELLSEFQGSDPAHPAQAGGRPVNLRGGWWLLGVPPADRQVFVSLIALDTDPAFRAALDERWQALDLTGPVLLYDYGDLQNRYAGARAPRTERALDPLLVINVLARARGRLLLPHTPLALEPGYLKRDLATDDPRIVAACRTSGSGRAAGGVS
jgi:hypothetical protein